MYVVIEGNTRAAIHKQIVENGESGGRVAGPIAKKVLEELLDDI